MKFEWDEQKNQENIKKHGFDFSDAHKVFELPMLVNLDDRSRDILEKRWLADNKATLHDLAAEYGVSAERIRQLEKNAMKKVRGLMEA